MVSKEHLERVAKRRDSLQAKLRERLTGCLDIDLEIGAGHGHWLVDYAAAHPDRRCLGLDLVGDRIERARRKASRTGLENVAFERAEAGEALELLPPGIVLRRVFLLFPDPWPKKRHWKYRIINARLLSLLAGRSKPGAQLFFRTDHLEYFAWAARKLQEHPAWSLSEQVSWPFERETVFQAKAKSYRSLSALRFEG